MDYTQNLHLPQFAATDRIHHDDFNDAFAAIDAAMPRIAVGTYVGTNEYGEEHPNTLTFDFAPKLVMVKPVTSPYSPMMLFPVDTGESYIMASYTRVTTNTSFIYPAWSADGKTVSWYNPDSAEKQLNAGKYYYFAIG